MSGPAKSVLETNLAALQRVQPELAERIRWGVSSDHVVRRADGTVVLRLGASSRPLSFPTDDLARALRGPKPPTHGLILGVGLGESVDASLRIWNESTITAWDRDPWLMRVLLSRRDFSRALLGKRLRLALGADLLSLEPEAHDRTIEHPVLAQVYGNELASWRAPNKTGFALICTAGLFVDDVIRVLRERGFRVWGVDAQRVDTREFERTLGQVRPTLGVAVNQVLGLPEIFQTAGVPLVTWEIDPATDWLPVPRGPVPQSHLFTFRRSVAQQLADVGHGSVHWLPLAAPARRRKVEVSEEDRSTYAAPVSFVGSSMVSRARPYVAQVQRMLKGWLPVVGRPASQAPEVIRSVVAAQRAQGPEWCIPDRLEEAAPGFRDWVRRQGVAADPALLLSELPAAEHRLKSVAALASFGVQVWGDAGWKSLEAVGVTTRGFAGHFRALNRIYQLSQINIDIGRLYQSDIVTMRVFDVLACGGFVLAAHSAELEDLFEVGVEVDAWRTHEELVEKVGFYLANPDAAAEMARRGQAAVLERHRIDQRVDRILSVSGLAPSAAQSE